MSQSLSHLFSSLGAEVIGIDSVVKQMLKDVRGNEVVGTNTVKSERQPLIGIPTVDSVAKSSGADGLTGGLGVIGSGIGGSGLLKSVVSPFGLIGSLVGGLLGLFGGGGGDAPTPLPKFTLPDSLKIDAGVSEDSRAPIVGASYAQNSRAGSNTSSSASPSITVQVQAMDSKSFLDHSNEIALAVRQAMLESSVLSDVIREM